MGLFKKRQTDPAEIERLKAEIASMSARLKAADDANNELDTTVRGLVTRLDAPTHAPPPPAPSVPSVPAVQPAEIDMINAKIERLATRIEVVGTAEPVVPTAPTVDVADIEELGAKMQRISERIDEIDGRITSISTELANQITEISGEIDGLGGTELPTDEVIDELRDAQLRLAGEQARYQIAFRQDLAELADRLRRA
jgi:tetrahydromethanopterin S-methyltransferase subunit G